MKTLKTILQVEDDLNDVYLVSHSLRKGGIACRLHVARDGKQAINYLQGVEDYADREKHPVPDLVLLDLKLPRVMGLDVLQWIRRQFGSRIIVIVLTSSVLESDIAKAYTCGANAFLIKPTDISVLQSMLKTACDFWLTHNTPPQETTSQSPMEGVVSLDRLGRPRELLPPSSLLPFTQRGTGPLFDISI